MTEYFIPTIVGIISALGSGFASFIFTRSKYRSEVRAQDIANLQEALNFFKNVCTEMRQEQEEAAKKRQYLSDQINELWLENQQLKADNYQLRQTITEQQSRIDKLEETLRKLPQKYHGKYFQKSPQTI